MWGRFLPALKGRVSTRETDDRRRARVAAALQVWGNRIQRSVFVAVLENDDLTELAARIEEMIDPDRDSVYLFRQCGTCWEACRVQGQATVEEEPRFGAIL